MLENKIISTVTPENQINQRKGIVIANIRQNNRQDPHTTHKTQQTAIPNTRLETTDNNRPLRHNSQKNKTTDSKQHITDTRLDTRHNRQQTARLAVERKKK